MLRLNRLYIIVLGFVILFIIYSLFGMNIAILVALAIALEQREH